MIKTYYTKIIPYLHYDYAALHNDYTVHILFYMKHRIAQLYRTKYTITRITT